MIRWI